MADRSITITDFSTGMTPYEKRGVARLIKNLDIFSDPSHLKSSRRTTKVSSTTVDGLVYWMEDGSPWDTNRYAYDENGAIYEEDSGGTWSKLRTVSNSSGNGLLVANDTLWYAQDEDLGIYEFLSGTPTFDDSFITFNDDSNSVTGQTYTLATSINEGATHRRTLSPSYDPIKSVTIDVDTVGTGDWTVTVHDEKNVAVGSATITNGNMSTGDVVFTFTTPLRVRIGASYHFHVTSTVADGVVTTGTSSDLEDCDFSTQPGILINVPFHPMVNVEEDIIIGNERYIAVYDMATGGTGSSAYNPNTVTLDPGFRVRSIAKFDEYIVAATYHGSDIEKSERARLFFWDTISPTYNYYTDVTVGAPNAVHNSRNSLIGVYGNRGAIYQNSEPFDDVVANIPNIADGKVVEVLPGAITEFEGKTLIGYSGSTDDANLEQGVYAYGRQSNDLPASLSLPFTISTGTTTGTTLKIGAVKSFGSDLYISWDDNGTFGVDKVAAGDNSNTSGSWESALFDANSPQHEKLAKSLVITFEALSGSETITPKYRIDRAANFTTGTTVSTTGEVRAEVDINSRWKEIEIGFNYVSGTSFPVVTGVYLLYDDLRDERPEGAN